MNDSLFTALSFSGGKQSSAILWMVLRGDIPRPEDFIVLTADPGMENSATYEYVAMMFNECEKQGIHCKVVPGPNLYEDLLTNKQRNHIYQPAYWVKDPAKKDVGKLRQKCTEQYKIRPMIRYLRLYLEEQYGIHRKHTRPGEDLIEQWIGFSYDEVFRIKASDKKFVRLTYPLIERKLTNADVDRYFQENDLPVPPRSVCNACFANGLSTLKRMYEERPEDWAQAVRVDKAVRDLSHCGIKQQVFVSKTLFPLEELAAHNFKVGDDKDHDSYSCDSGYCFS